MSARDEQLAVESLQAAQNAIQDAIQSSRLAGYGSLLVGELHEAWERVQHALDMAEGRA